MPVEQGSLPTKPKLVWADAPWTVAALLGIWGVMIGIEEFKLANAVMVLTALSCAIRLFRDSIETRPRRVISFVLGLFVLGAFVWGDFHFTEKKKQASEAREKELPGLRQQISDLQGTIAKQKTDLETRDSREDQQLADIKAQNTTLQNSVKTKDAALIDIAKQQYSLNFLPQVLVLWNDSTNDLKVQNNGKTNFTIAGLSIDGSVLQKETIDTPAFVTPGAATGFALTDAGKQVVLLKALSSASPDISYAGVAYIQTLDEKKYEVSFTLHFIIKDGAISRTFVMDRETKPSDWSGLQ